MGTPSFEDPVGSFTGKRSSAINQSINQSNNLQISGPHCIFACKVPQTHKRVKRKLIIIIMIIIIILYSNTYMHTYLKSWTAKLTLSL